MTGDTKSIMGNGKRHMFPLLLVPLPPIPALSLSLKHSSKGADGISSMQLWYRVWYMDVGSETWQCDKSKGRLPMPHDSSAFSKGFTYLDTTIDDRNIFE